MKLTIETDLLPDEVLMVNAYADGINLRFEHDNLGTVSSQVLCRLDALLQDE